MQISYPAQVIGSLSEIAVRDHDLLQGLTDDDHVGYTKDAEVVVIVDAKILTHKNLATAHQDAPGLIATHAGDAAAHHAKYTDGEAEAVADTQIATHAGVATAHQDAPGLIATHAGDAAAHHAKYTDGEAEAVADTQIATHAGVATAHQDAPGLIATHAGVSDAHHVRPVDDELMPKEHKADHQYAGSDVINIGELAGVPEILMSKMRAYRATTNQTIPQNTITKIELNAESYDPQNIYDHVTNFKYVVPATGYYLVMGALYYDTIAADVNVTIYLRNNGTTFVEWNKTTPISQKFFLRLTDIQYLTVGDEITLWTNQTAVGGQDVKFGSHRTFMAIHRLS